MRHATHSIMRRGVGSLLVLGALIFAAAGDAAGVDEDQGGQREVLAASDFVWDLDGWGVVGEECKPLSHGPKMARGGDLGNATWYFSAPAKFLGAKKEAYGGFLTFRHGYFEYDR
ncbi:hypothetical protein T484DRAFT_1789162 [Baffinella frigidus]|nr:hypothetical protein T484DRAFT_1789162 [Cryptophyta sp. CCMP2293]